MKTLTASNNSWHFKLAKIGGLNAWRPQHDICSYTRHCIYGALLVLLIMASSVGIANILVHTILSVSFSLWYMENLFSELGIMGSVLFCGVSITALIVYHVNRYHEREYVCKPDGFIVSAYKSYKNKYCLKIDINFE